MVPPIPSALSLMVPREVLAKPVSQTVTSIINGLRLTADEDTKYQAVTYKDQEYLINENGTIQKNKKNIKDADDYYYCTDSKGVLRHERSTEKCTIKH